MYGCGKKQTLTVWGKSPIFVCVRGLTIGNEMDNCEGKRQRRWTWKVGVKKSVIDYHLFLRGLLVEKMVIEVSGKNNIGLLQPSAGTETLLSKWGGGGGGGADFFWYKSHGLGVEGGCATFHT